jgi:CRISPR-associated protein Csm1
VILEGGGHFYLLAPASQVNEHQLDALVGEVTTVLLKEHGTDLFVAIDSVPMSISDVRAPASLTARWRQLGGRVAEAKRRKGGALLPEAQHALFKPAESAGHGWHWCSVCQGPIRNPEPTNPDDPETPLTEAGRDRKRKCHVCRGMEEVGLRLRRGAVMAVWDWDTDPDDADPHAADAGLSDDQRWRRTLRLLGTDVLIPPPAEWRHTSRDWGDRVDAPVGTTVTVYRLQDADLDQANKDATRLGARGAGVGFRLLAQATPLRAGANPDDPARSDVMDLGELAEAGPGVQRLGFLRADVDNLGQVFLQGLQVGGKDAGTLARQTALSGSLRLFFEAHLGVLCDKLNSDLRSQSPERSDQLYLIYSGGDDLFLAGAWDAVVRASVTIHDAFARYAGGNPAIHLSGGLAIVHDKYPVRQAADDAGEALEEAKGRPGKDAVSVFGRTVPWAILGSAQGMADTLAKQVADRSGETPRQLLRLALRLCTMETTIGARRAKDKRTRTAATDGTAVGSPERQVAWGPWAWQGAYALGRMRNDGRVPAALIEDIRKLLLNADGIDQLFVAATWADLAIRTKTKK